jgi:two-component system phosphate regulon response regulator OmpR
MLKTAKILICDPNPANAGELEGYLAAHGCKVTAAGSAESLDRLIESDSFDLVLIDMGLEGVDPLTLARRLSDRPRLGIVMLTASADPIERIVALEAGADDCLARPYELRELLARLRAILRRLAKSEPMAVLPGFNGRALAIGACALDMDARTLRGPTGREMMLTEMEIALLRAFIEHPNQALNRDELAELAYGRTWNPFDRSLDIRISRLRRKIERDPNKPEVILTVRGVGYRFETRRV